MSDFLRVNQPRIDKIISFLGMVEKSYKSNRADRAELLDLLEQIDEALEQLAPADADDQAGEPAEDEGPDNEELIRKAENYTQISRQAPRSPSTYRREDLQPLVDKIPEGLLTSLLTHLTNRISEILEDELSG